MQSAQEIYATAIQHLPPEERLRLAALILNELARPDILMLEGYSDKWSDEDLRDATAYSLRRFQEEPPEDEQSG